MLPLPADWCSTFDELNANTNWYDTMRSLSMLADRLVPTILLPVSRVRPHRRAVVSMMKRLLLCIGYNTLCGRIIKPAVNVLRLNLALDPLAS